jgi:alginate O-acetyltransferase complex protein AlgI
MLFNSIDFCFFLPTVFILYWFIANKNLKVQNLLLLISSYVFYGWWDWRFLSLIVFSSCIDYYIGIILSRTTNDNKRTFLLITSIIVNLGLLMFFKYFNFFVESLSTAFTFLGRPIETSRLNIILPVGISFYTFQTLSYTIDVYKHKLKPTEDIISFLTFVSFFPQLVAGPIERANNLLPQFYKKRYFHYEKAADGLRQILWGLFKKIVIADNCAELVNQIFDNTDKYDGSTLALGAILFSFQIYGDFSGYSDIAIGTSRLFGFNLQKNFDFPYFSRDIAEFWRRWHISLSTWFRDYLYIPLGGSKGGGWASIRNVFIIFIVSGFWHGANWTFITWGILNALYFLPLLLLKKNRTNLNTIADGKPFPSFIELIQVLLTFSLTTIAWIFFRAESISQAFIIINKIFSVSLLTLPLVKRKAVIGLVILFILFEWIGRKDKYALEKIGQNINRWLRYTLYCFLIILMFIFTEEEQEFIYFQF